MQIINCEQGSEDWLKARAGRPTASNFNKIITPTGQKSSQSEKYVFEVLADILSGGKASGGFEGNSHTRRGTELEPEAAAFYAELKGMEVQEVGFCLSECGNYGASPDRLVGDDGLAEFKCPAPHTHAQYIYTGKVDSVYIPQVQGQMLVTGRKWCDWMSYHPDMPPLIIRVERDEVFLIKLRKYLAEFNELLEEKKERLKQLGYL